MERFENLSDIGKEIRVARRLLSRFEEEGKDSLVVQLLKTMPSLMREYAIQAQREHEYLHIDMLMVFIGQFLLLLGKELKEHFGEDRIGLIDRLRPKIGDLARQCFEITNTEAIEYHATTDPNIANDDQPEDGD